MDFFHIFPMNFSRNLTFIFFSWLRKLLLFPFFSMELFFTFFFFSFSLSSFYFFFFFFFLLLILLLLFPLLPSFPSWTTPPGRAKDWEEILFKILKRMKKLGGVKFRWKFFFQSSRSHTALYSKIPPASVPLSLSFPFLFLFLAHSKWIIITS